ncbi:MAG TPA: two-component regulator propeller domain-containing protein [Saprospiraceae bacterium]|nr:two-component regulator propeller domain-containing protein [Saprospiraceae bacterium]HMQ84913.1 two-component regulator propeller domain-containing protein [Saprospiraceae bacterium]
MASKTTCNMRMAFLILFIGTGLDAQVPLYFTHFTAKEGLSDNQVQCVFRDKLGYLWVGTAKGLNRFDGYQFKTYLPDAQNRQKSIGNENIQDIGQDEGGAIWIASTNGLHVFDPRTETFRAWKNTGRNDGSLPNSLIWSFYIESPEALWLACDNRDLCLFNPKKETFKTYPWKSYLDWAVPEKAHLDYKTIFQVWPISEQELLLVTNVGLFGFDKTKEQFCHYSDIPNGYPPMKPNAEGTYSSLVLGDQFLTYDPTEKRWSKVHLSMNLQGEGQAEKALTAHLLGANYWIGSPDGIFLLNANTHSFEPIISANSDTRCAPFGLMMDGHLDDAGLLWIGGEQGLWMFSPLSQYFIHTFLRPPVFSQQNNTYHQFLDSRFDGKRYLLDRYGQELVVEDGTKYGQRIKLSGIATLLFEDAKGLLWIGAGNRLFHYNRTKKLPQPFDHTAPLFDPSVSSVFTSMTQDEAGNYWIGNDNTGLLVWLPHENKWWIPGEEEGFISHSVSKIFVHRERQTIWIATSDYGLFRYDQKNRQFILYQQDERYPDKSLGAYIINDICKDRLGRIWVATDLGGISRFDYNAPETQAFTTINIEDGLPSNQVHSVTEDANGNIWVGTTKGLAWVDCQSLRVRSFGAEDGLATDNLDLPLALTSDGRICIGTPFGYQSFQPDSLLMEKVDPGILITSFKIFDQEYSDSININFLREITLPWKDNFFQIEFSSKNFDQAAKNEYAHRLIGLDKDWVLIQNRHTISYTNVPPGAYTLEIKSGRESHWNEVGLRLNISISPPYWATWWFRGAMFLLLFSSVAGLYRWRMATIRREEKLKAIFNERIARTEMAALRAQMNPHFIFNCLSSINRFILVNQPDEASDFLTRFSRLIRLILDNSRSEKVTLDKELEALRLYIEMEQMRFANRFAYQIIIAPDIQVEHLEIPPLLIQPYVENAIWHGFMHKKSEGLLQIKIYFERNVLFIEIKDDGVGRKRAQELKSRSALTHKSYGMQLTSERLSMFQQLYGIRAKVETTDLMDALGNALGTRVLLQIVL